MLKTIQNTYLLKQTAGGYGFHDAIETLKKAREVYLASLGSDIVEHASESFLDSSLLVIGGTLVISTGLLVSSGVSSYKRNKKLSKALSVTATNRVKNSETIINESDLMDEV